MFFYVLYLLEAIIVIQASLAYSYGLWSWKQASQRVWSKPFAVFTEHGGMWGDAFLVSPLAAWSCHFYYRQWSGKGVVTCFIISLAVTGLMLDHWRKNTKRFVETFAMDEELTAAGWLHGAYMVLALTIVLLMFFGTSNVGQGFATVLAVGLGIHIAIGLLQPELSTFGRLRVSTITQLLFAWFMLLIGWRNIVGN